MKLTMDVNEVMQQKGMDAAKLAEAANIPPSLADQILQGQSVQLDLPTLSRICTALGVLPHQIVKSVEEKQPSASEGEWPRSIEEEAAVVGTTATSEPEEPEQTTETKII